MRCRRAARAAVANQPRHADPRSPTPSGLSIRSCVVADLRRDTDADCAVRCEPRFEFERDWIPGKSFGPRNGSWRKNQSACRMAIEGLYVPPQRDFDRLQNPMLLVKMNQVEDSRGPRDRNAVEVNQPNSISFIGGKALHENLEHFDGLACSIDNNQAWA